MRKGESSSVFVVFTPRFALCAPTDFVRGKTKCEESDVNAFIMNTQFLNSDNLGTENFVIVTTISRAKRRRNLDHYPTL